MASKLVNQMQFHLHIQLQFLLLMFLTLSYLQPILTSPLPPPPVLWINPSSHSQNQALHLAGSSENTFYHRQSLFQPTFNHEEHTVSLQTRAYDYEDCAYLREQAKRACHGLGIHTGSYSECLLEYHRYLIMNNICISSLTYLLSILSPDPDFKPNIGYAKSALKLCSKWTLSITTLSFISQQLYRYKL
jgi:hypothetical protein